MGLWVSYVRRGLKREESGGIGGGVEVRMIGGEGRLRGHWMMTRGNNG